MPPIAAQVQNLSRSWRDRKTRGPLGTIERIRYVPSPGPNTAAVLSHYFRGVGPARVERLTSQAASDVYLAPRIRESPDNGQTWGDWVAVPEKDVRQGRFYMALHELGRVHDPSSGRLFRLTLQRLFIGDPAEILGKAFKTGNHNDYRDHAVYQLSDDNGLTWGPMQLIKFEDGPEFDPADWGNDAYLARNRMYSGYNAIVAPDGTLLYSACVKVLHEQDGVREDVCGVRLFKAAWNATAGRYDWRSPFLLTVSTRISARGLMEPWLATLADGRLYLDMRGSSSEWTPGRHWYSVSKDKGETWSPVTDLRYDTGEQFYSPSTFAKTLRSARTGKLYWVGNIAPEPPKGNWPRRPLVLAEFDEERVAIRKSTVTVIDDYEPDGDASPYVQFSNFSLVEHTETRAFELYLTRYGEAGTLQEKTYWQASAFKYVIVLD
ncbi:MAG: exo-alpha-sialidase [Lentisphaerae bacterium]|nr:exo-alpha-sialidase [Lentisphaerota bacterium]